MARGGYIRLHRKMIEWGWYTDANTMRVFIHLLIIAQYEDGEFLGHKVPRGCAVCTIPSLSAALGMTVQQVRTALEHLKATGEITVSKTPKFSIIAVSAYDEYQTDNSQSTVNQQSSNSQVTGEQQSSNTIKEIKKEKNKKVNNYYSKGPKDGNAGASYDIQKAVANASTTVPTVTKREKR